MPVRARNLLIHITTQPLDHKNISSQKQVKIPFLEPLGSRPKFLGSLITDQIRELSEELGRGGKAQSPTRQAIVLKHPPEAGPKLSKISPSALPLIHLLHAAPTLLAFQKGKLTQDTKLSALLSISACWNVLQSQSICA